MTDWIATSLSPQHQQVTYRRGESSKSIEQFRRANKDARPDTLYRFNSGNIEIKAGAATLRNRSLWNSFKSRLTTVAHTFTRAHRMQSSKSSRALRRAEAARDTAVSQFVADVANGKLDRADAQKRLGQIAALNDQVTARQPIQVTLDDTKMILPPEERSAKTDASLAAVMQEAVQTAMEAMPEEIDVLTQKFDDIFSDAKALDPNAHQGANNRHAAHSIVKLGKMAMPGLTAARHDALWGKTTIQVLQDKGGDHKQPLADFEATTLAEFAARAVHADTLRKQPPSDLQEYALDDLIARCQGPGGGAAAIDFVKNAEPATLKSLMVELTSSIKVEKEPTKVALFEALKTAIASDLPTLKRLTLPGDETVPEQGAWICDALQQACTLKDDQGQHLYADEQLESLFDRVYQLELPNQSDEYFRRGEGAVGLIMGMIERYSDGAINDISDEALRVIAGACDDADSFVPQNGPNVKGAPHPEQVMQFVTDVLETMKGFDATPKLKAFLQKVHDGFTGRDPNGGEAKPLNRALVDHADRFIRSLLLLRFVNPRMTDCVAKPGTPIKAQTMVTKYATPLLQSVANGPTMLKTDKKVKKMVDDYFRAVEKQHPSDATPELKKAAQDTAATYKATLLAQFADDSITNRMFSRLFGRTINLPLLDA